MGFQIGGAILDFVVLSILRRQEAYGYLLTQQVRSILDVSETAMYPALRRLQKSGLLTASDRPYQGRNRRYYRITPEGERVQADYAAAWQEFRGNMDEILNGGDYEHGSVF